MRISETEDGTAPWHFRLPVIRNLILNQFLEELKKP